ncbi:hypothetical protein MLD38_040298 [Melastoma candidum]|uniref:Uncharacterized protein n=1 Tax=Melastoma candidum TaxID=119954 RepID=A0ACB9L5J1_9MYRT|nr:hypothetical protein MLD38_040298 [Melastoma candidum]
MEEGEEKARIAILGAGIFVKSSYIPTLAEISDIVDAGAIWSRSEEWNVSGGYGDLDEIVWDNLLPAVAVVLAGHVQESMFFKKHRQQLKITGLNLSLMVVADVGDIFSSSWISDVTNRAQGGFMLDMGVHFISGLKTHIGCELTSVSATTTHVDLTLLLIP